MRCDDTSIYLRTICPIIKSVEMITPDLYVNITSAPEAQRETICV